MTLSSIVKFLKLSNKSISAYLQDAGFNLVFKDLEHPATESYIKEVNGIEVEIEFLTDSLVRRDKHKNVEIAGVVAQSLSYLTLSLQLNRKFETYAGESGFVVDPSAWIFHKGLTFTRRNSISKMYKDLYGIWYVGTQLGDFSEKAIDELFCLGARHLKWFKSLQGNLQNWINNASPMDWAMLEEQDPSGKLKKLNFERIVKKIISP